MTRIFDFPRSAANRIEAGRSSPGAREAAEARYHDRGDFVTPPLANVATCPSGEHGISGGTLLQGGEAASRLAHNQENAGASPAPATNSPFAGEGKPLRECGASGGAGGGTLDLSPPLELVLRMIAIHDRMSVEALLWEFAAERAKRIGLGALVRSAADHPNAGDRG